MIGRMIDFAALLLAGTAGLYALFMNAGMGIPASCLLTFGCMGLAKYIWRHRPARRRITAARAEASLLSIALRGDLDALQTLSQRADGVILLRHPEGKLTLNEVFETWREQGDGAVLVATCEVEEAAKCFAKSRNMRILDRKYLVKRIQSTGLYVVETPHREAVSSRIALAWENVRPGPRAIICGLSLLGFYIVTGHMICLICGLFVFGTAGAKMIEQKAGAQ